MALIECPECKQRISDRAISCPSCGCPIENLNPGGEEGIQAPNKPSDRVKEKTVGEITLGDKISGFGIVWTVLAVILAIILCFSSGEMVMLLIFGIPGALSGLSIILIGFIVNLFQSMERALWKIENLLEKLNA